MERGQSSKDNRNSVPTHPERPLSTGERLFGVSVGEDAPVARGSGLEESATTTKPTDSGVQISDPEGGATLTPQQSNPYDVKHYGDISVLDTGPFSSAR
jgi:hypothetical protein